MEFTQKERQLFDEWKQNGYNWTNWYERNQALSREFIKGLTDEQIKSTFKLGKRNSLIESGNTLQTDMGKFMKKAIQNLNLNKSAIDSFNNITNITCKDSESLKRINKVLNNQTNDFLTFQDVINKVFKGGYYRIYGSRTIENYHNAEVLHAIYNTFGGVAVVKTQRKEIAVKLEIGGKNTIQPIELIDAIELIKEIRDEQYSKTNIDENTLKEFKDRVEMNEVVKRI